ncbi:MAG TPA: sortase, partial [Patescibacteria group bacterium]|nr:sortase [Patescibacteria group bacterium]
AEILKTGVWRVPDFGTPEDDGPSEPVERGADSQIGPSELVERGADSQIGLPIILAAHRFGYVTWTNSFRTLNSFYSLPKLKVGDRVEIVWNQRKYVYEIYKEETGTAITDYTADLILYTCDLWNSPTRIFKYARRSATK